MRVSVISRWFNEAFFAPFFLGHYAWADEIVVCLERSTTDASAEIVGRHPNARIEWWDDGGVLDDGVFSARMSDLAARLESDWVIRADADELCFPPDADPRRALEQADGNCIVVRYRWVYRHATEAALDPSRPALAQRRHGGPYTIWPGMGATYTKPAIVRPEAGIRWRPGEQGCEPNRAVRISRTQWDGVHWQMADVDEAVRRLLTSEARISERNRKNGWGVRNFTEEMIRAECARHLNDPRVL